MEITVQHGSCLLGTCTVIGYVPVKSRALINRQKPKNIKGLAQKTNFGFSAALSSCFRTKCSLLFRHSFVQMVIYLIFFSVTSTETERKYTCGLRTSITSYTANVGYPCWLPCWSQPIIVFCTLIITPALNDGATFGNDKDISKVLPKQADLKQWHTTY